MNQNFIVVKGDLPSMICPNCSQYNDDEARFCWSCGYSLDEKSKEQKRFFCTNCSAEIRYEDVFCSKCGKQVRPDPINQANAITPPKVPINIPPPIDNQQVPPRQPMIYRQQKKQMPFWLVGLLIFIGLCLLGSILGNNNGSTSSREQSTVTPKRSIVTATLTPETPILTPTAIEYYAQASSLTLNYNTKLRMGPGTEYDSEGVIEPGTQVPVYGRYGESNWVLVDYEKNYWMNSESGQLENSIDELPVMATFTPTMTPLPTATNTPIPTATKIPPITLKEIYHNFRYMTGLQFEEYRNTLPGRIVEESVEVRNVDSYGRISIKGDWSPLILNITDYCVVVIGMPQSKSIKLDGGEMIAIRARIKHLLGNYHYYYNCENTLVLEYIN